MTHYEEITNGIKGFFYISLICAAIGGCRELSGMNKQPTQYADATPEIRAIKALHHNGLDGLSLTVEESWDKRDTWARQLNFHDYDYDGKLDEVFLRQNNRRDLWITNLNEVANWQSIFEEMRTRRLGNVINNIRKYRTL